MMEQNHNNPYPKKSDEHENSPEYFGGGNQEKTEENSEIISE